ncbi:MAG: 50S ribosomal protein L32 [Patescibacteria group bacterium]
MPQEPKKRHSRQRQGKRRATIKLSAPSFIDCSNCGAVILPHTVCPKCGYYKGKPFIRIEKEKPKEAKEETESSEARSGSAGKNENPKEE